MRFQPTIVPNPSAMATATFPNQDELRRVVNVLLIVGRHLPAPLDRVGIGASPRLFVLPPRLSPSHDIVECKA
jgi:hypothetical protein